MVPEGSTPAIPASAMEPTGEAQLPPPPTVAGTMAPCSWQASSSVRGLAIEQKLKP